MQTVSEALFPVDSINIQPGITPPKRSALILKAFLEKLKIPKYYKLYITFRKGFRIGADRFGGAIQTNLTSFRLIYGLQCGVLAKRQKTMHDEIAKSQVDGVETT